MSYTLTKLILWLLGAAVLGGMLGYLFRGRPPVIDPAHHPSAGKHLRATDDDELGRLRQRVDRLETQLSLAIAERDRLRYDLDRGSDPDDAPAPVSTHVTSTGITFAGVEATGVAASDVEVEATEDDSTEPESTEDDSSEDDSSEDESNDPDDTSGFDSSDPGSTDSDISDSGSTDSGSTDSGSTGVVPDV